MFLEKKKNINLNGLQVLFTKKSDIMQSTDFREALITFLKESNQETALRNKIVTIVLKTDYSQKDRTNPRAWVPNENIDKPHFQGQH